MPVESPDALLEALRAALAPQYDVVRQLGAGGMGSVFLARDATLDRPVAVKVISPELSASKTFRDRFLQEARTVAKLRHPNIVAVYAAGESAGLLYFVMEYVEGESLRDLLDREGRCEPERARRILRDLASALAYAHEAGIVHRDIKPENVLLNVQGSPLLTDFGVARAFSAPGAPGAPEEGRLTGTGFVLGSPRYMSPEQATGERQLDGRSDIYALGLVGYEMLTGAPAFGATTAGSLIVKQLTERPAPLATRVPGVPSDLAAAVERALEKDPADRWPDGAAMARALDGEQSHGAPARVPGRDGAAARRRRVLPFAAAALLVTLLAAWFVVRGRGGVPAGVDPRRSFFVAPFEVQSGDPQLQWLREGSVSMLSLNLAQWADLSVVDYERSLDLLRDAELENARRVSLDDARALARDAGAWTVVTGQVIGTGDSLTVVARTFDVASGRRLDEASRSSARAADPRSLYDALARDLLDLVGAPPVTLELAKTTTSSVAAYRAYLEGSHALNNWKLDQADSLFRRAVAADSTFALAYYRRALTLGWKRAGDPEQLAAVRRANQFAGRLPARERGMVAAYTDLSNALHASIGNDTAQRDALYAAAQDKYAAVVRRDTSDVEAWFGLGDAYYHHQPDNGPRSLANANNALRAFDRALALDSTFYLAYSHKLDLYRRATGASSNAVLDGDSLRLLPTDSARRAFGPERVAQARQEARRRAVRDGRAWLAADPVPQAYQLLVSIYAEAGHFDSAATLLREAIANPATRSPRFPYLLAAVETRTDPAAALATLRTALREVDAADIRAERGNPFEAYEIVLLGSEAATINGRVEELDAVEALAASLEPEVPGAPKTPPGRRTRWATVRPRLALGLPATPERAFVDSGIAFVDRLEGRSGEQSRRQGTSVTYIAYLATREPRYAATVRRWSGETYPELDALEALARGDTAAATAAARTFPSADSAARAGGTISAARWVARAEALEGLGDARGALAAYELLEPVRLQGTPADAGPALYARSLLARGRLREQLGERDAAIAAYERFLTLWKEADPALQPQLREARDGLARLRDAGAVTPVR